MIPKWFSQQNYRKENEIGELLFWLLNVCAHLGCVELVTYLLSVQLYHKCRTTLLKYPIELYLVVCLHISYKYMQGDPIDIQTWLTFLRNSTITTTEFKGLEILILQTIDYQLFPLTHSLLPHDWPQLFQNMSKKTIISLVLQFISEEIYQDSNFLLSNLNSKAYQYCRFQIHCLIVNYSFLL